MTRPILLTAALLALMLATAAPAQETTTPAPVVPATDAPAVPATDAPAADAATPPPAAVDDLPLGKPVTEDGIGSTYVEATHGDWEQRCVRTEDGSNPCQLYQLLRDETKNPVAEFSVFGLPKGGQAVAGATAVVPLETLLTADVTLQVDGGAAKKYPFSWCSPIGCVSRIGFTGDEVAALKKGSAMTMSIVPVAAPDQKVTLKISLKGFTAGFDAVNTSNGN